MKNILILSSILLAAFVIISCNKDEPTEPFKPDCESIYPPYDGIIADFEPTFEWCADSNSTEYRLQISEDITFSNLLFDTVSTTNALRPYYYPPDPNIQNSFFVNILDWGRQHYWRVAGITNSQQQPWSDTYQFQTKDIRNDIIGMHQAIKRRYVHYSNGKWINDTIVGTPYMLVEKVPETRSIKITEVGGDFEKEMDVLWDYIWEDSPSYGEFQIQGDSFSIFMTDYEYPAPFDGYHFSGRH